MPGLWTAKSLFLGPGAFMSRSAEIIYLEPGLPYESLYRWIAITELIYLGPGLSLKSFYTWALDSATLELIYLSPRLPLKSLPRSWTDAELLYEVLLNN
jgi:hypothetical protein